MINVFAIFQYRYYALNYFVYTILVKLKKWTFSTTIRITIHNLWCIINNNSFIKHNCVQLYLSGALFINSSIKRFLRTT